MTTASGTNEAPTGARHRSLAAAAAAGLLVMLAASSPRAEGPPPSLDATDLGQGRFSSMHMRLQKTILNINVADIDLRFDKAAQSRFAELAQGKAYSEALAQQLALAAFGAGHVVLQMRFLRDISLDRWMGVVRDNLKLAREATLITAEIEQRVDQGLPQWFAALKSRGYEKGDRILYAVAPDSVRTVVVAPNGQVLLDRLDRDPASRRVVLGSYFAPKSDFREPLLRSLFEAGH